MVQAVQHKPFCVVAEMQNMLTDTGVMGSGQILRERERLGPWPWRGTLLSFIPQKKKKTERGRDRKREREREKER